jgi:hypothetical protein
MYLYGTSLCTEYYYLLSLSNKYVFHVFNVNGLYDKNQCEMNKHKFLKSGSQKMA